MSKEETQTRKKRKYDDILTEMSKEKTPEKTRKKRKRKYDEKKEEILFDKFGISTLTKIKKDLDFDEFYKNNIVVPSVGRFYISSHGSQLLHTDFPKIKIPDNFHLYFQSNFGETCEGFNNEETTSFNCYGGMFKNFIKVNDNGKIEWINYCEPGSEIYNCMLVPDRYFLSKILYCGDKFQASVYNINIPTLLSDIFIKIREFCHNEKIEEVALFCSFCLDEDKRTNMASYVNYVFNFDIDENTPLSVEEDIDVEQHDTDSNSDTYSSNSDTDSFNIHVNNDIDENKIPEKYRIHYEDNFNDWLDDINGGHKTKKRFTKKKITKKRFTKQRFTKKKMTKKKFTK